ncbi:MAG: hypothetical protein JJU40_06945 [Rhodobacteraceae bacterium]|nr:hypothetical protein [Paracoccaceae bacterium]
MAWGHHPIRPGGAELRAALGAGPGLWVVLGLLGAGLNLIMLAGPL